MSVVSVIQHATRMRRIILSSEALSGSTIFFSHYLVNRTIFGKMLLNINVCFEFIHMLVNKFSLQQQIGEILT
jgi:hypothetical protein